MNGLYLESQHTHVYTLCGSTACSTSSPTETWHGCSSTCTAAVHSGRPHTFKVQTPWCSCRIDAAPTYQEGGVGREQRLGCGHFAEQGHVLRLQGRACVAWSSCMRRRFLAARNCFCSSPAWDACGAPRCCGGGKPALRPHHGWFTYMEAPNRPRHCHQHCRMPGPRH